MVDPQALIFVLQCSPRQPETESHSYVFGHCKWGPISPGAVAQQAVGFIVSNHTLGFGIEVEHPSQAVGCICQMNQCAGDVPFSYWRAQIPRLAAADAVDEVRKMIASTMTMRPRFL